MVACGRSGLLKKQEANISLMTQFVKINVKTYISNLYSVFLKFMQNKKTYLLLSKLLYYNVGLCTTNRLCLFFSPTTFWYR